MYEAQIEKVCSNKQQIVNKKTYQNNASVASGNGLNVCQSFSNNLFRLYYNAIEFTLLITAWVIASSNPGSGIVINSNFNEYGG